MSAVAERVSRGAALLDKYDPDWWKPDVPNAIDLSTLNLVSGELCVLGQRCPAAILEDYGSDVAGSRYWAYLEELSAWDGSEEKDGWASEHGFTLDRLSGFDTGAADRWRALTGEWKRVITERRAAS